MNAASGSRSIPWDAPEEHWVGSFGDPADMAYLIAFLASPLARYITGELIAVDGGVQRFAF